MGPESNTNWNLKSNLPQLPAPYPPSALEFKWAQLIYESVSLRVAVKWQQDLWLRESHLLLLPLFQVSALWSAEYDALHLTFAEVPCWLRWYRICLQRMSPGFSSWVGKIPGEENGYALQCSCLENFMDRGVWLATVHGVAKSQTRLSNKHYLNS